MGFQKSKLSWPNDHIRVSLLMEIIRVSSSWKLLGVNNSLFVFDHRLSVYRSSKRCQKKCIHLKIQKRVFLFRSEDGEDGLQINNGMEEWWMNFLFTISNLMTISEGSNVNCRLILIIRFTLMKSLSTRPVGTFVL